MNASQPTKRFFLKGAALSAVSALFMLALIVIDEVMAYEVIPRWLGVAVVALSVVAALGNLVLARLSERSPLP